MVLSLPRPHLPPRKILQRRRSVQTTVLSKLLASPEERRLLSRRKSRRKKLIVVTSWQNQYWTTKMRIPSKCDYFPFAIQLATLGQKGG
ncbi:hypothetical protein EAE96_004245 [Botrytis aclada]|nr:hypothetical protein EAE96_004245 [Botrytis aclada]